MFLLKLGSELQNLVKKFQSVKEDVSSVLRKYKQITDSISTTWDAEGVETSKSPLILVMNEKRDINV